MLLMNDPENPSKQTITIVDSLSFHEDIEAIIGKKVEIRGVDNIIKYLLENGYIKKMEITNFSMSNDNKRIFDNTKMISSINELTKKNNIDVVVDETIFDNLVENVNSSFKEVDNLLERYGYCTIFFCSTYQTYFGLIKLEHLNNKKYHNDAFENSGFAKYSDINKKVQILYKNTKYTYKYQTNAIYQIPNSDFRFIICTADNDLLELLINCFGEVVEGNMSRTFYPGLWNEPRQFVGSFNENKVFKIKINEKEIIEISVI